jgi:hypothetical protein
MTMLVDCRLRLGGSPDTTCVAAAQDAGFDTLDTVLQYCTDACVAGNFGALVQCIGENFSGDTCQAIELDGGGIGDAGCPEGCLEGIGICDPACAAIATTCSGGYDAGPCGASCTSCQQQCDQALRTCNASCPLADAGACFACNYDCNQQVVACDAACPTD